VKVDAATADAAMVGVAMVGVVTADVVAGTAAITAKVAAGVTDAGAAYRS